MVWGLYMIANGVNELIWHFAGYLRLTPDVNGVPGVLYDGAGTLGIAADEAMAYGAGRANERPEHLAGTRVGFAEFVTPSPYVWHLRPIGKLPHSPQIHVHLPKLALPKSPMPPLPADGGGWSDEPVPVTYHGGADQDLIYVPQVNWLINNNDVNAPSGVVAQNDDSAAKTLSFMLHEASDASFGSALELDGVDTTSLQNWVNARDSQASGVYGHDAPGAQPGATVNGVFQSTADADIHQPTNDVINNLVTALNQGFAGPPAPPPGDGATEPVHQVSVGSNILVNDAQLANLDGLSTGLAVLGNYYQTSAIVQTNVFNEQEHIHVGSIGGGTANVSILPNTMQNIADFDNVSPTLTSASGTTASGLNWTVDVLNGSLLDVHSLIQTNYLSNNDVVYQTSSTGVSQIITGGNDLVNSSVATLTANYDLIIVEGSYHQDDLIYQTNVVLDSNSVTLQSGSGTGSVIGGQNTVVNDGNITDVGDQSFQPMTKWSEGMIQELASNQPSLQASLIAGVFPGLSGTAHVLIVTGDYYDINYISQTNVLSDANVVSMAGGGTQTVVTGHDQVVNAATIIDGGSATSPYLQGNYYNDMILIQTNIISDGQKITGNNPNQLAPELVAFTSPTETSLSGQSVGAASPELHHHYHHDIISGILH
jgi:hypothetical protein